MARITGIELPNERTIVYALPVIYGIGITLSKKIVEEPKSLQTKESRFDGRRGSETSKGRRKISCRR